MAESRRSSGYLRVKLQRFPGHGMLERQLLGVQPETAIWDGLSVERVGVDRVSDGREVDPDLVGPPRLQPHPEHGVSRGVGQTSKCVMAGFPTPAAMSVGLSGSRPTGESMVPVSGKPSPTTTAL